MVCVSENTETFVAGAKYDKVLMPFDVRAHDLVQYGSDDTKTTVKSNIFWAKQHDKVGELLVSDFRRGRMVWISLSKHDTNRLPDKTRHDETYNFAKPVGVWRTNTAKEDNTGRCVPCYGRFTVYIDNGYTLCGLAWI